MKKERIIFRNRKCPVKSVSITDHTLEKAMWSGITSLNICDFEDVRMRNYWRKK